MDLMPVLDRLSELWAAMQRRELTEKEDEEMDHCLAVVAKYCWERAYLEFTSLLASETNDMEWMHEICAKIEQLHAPENKKKPGHKDTGKDRTV